MVGGAGHGADPIGTCWEASSNCSGEQALTIAGIIDTLEEGKCLWVGWGAGNKAVSEALDRDVGMADDDSTTAQSLWRSIVSQERVRERAGIEVGDLNGDIEFCV